MMRWIVGDKADLDNPIWMSLDADDEQSAKAEWCRIVGLEPDDADIDLYAEKLVKE